MELSNFTIVQDNLVQPSNKHHIHTREDALRVAEEYEGLFFFQYLKQLNEGYKPDELFGGGEAEQTWRTFLLMEYGNEIAKQQGVLKDSFYKQLVPKDQLTGGNHDSQN